MALEERPVLEDVIRRISLAKDTMPVIFLVTEDRDMIEKIFDHAGCFDLYRQRTEDGKTFYEEVDTFRQALYSREDRGNKGNIVQYTNPGTLNPRACRMDGYSGPFYYFCRDFHLLYSDSYSRDTYIRDFINAHEQNPVQIANLLISSPRKLIPRGLEAYIELIDVPMIGICEIRELIAEYQKGPVPDAFAAGFRGLNERQVRSILSMGYSRFGRVTAEGGDPADPELSEEISRYFQQLIVREKEMMVEKDGGISFVKVTDQPVGGLEGILEWIREQKKYLENPKQARARGMHFPKGILVAGLPGSGKSLMARKAAGELGLPLIQIHLSMILGSHVGESEANLNRALKLAEAIAPCVVWIDEIEKELGGTQGSGEADGGVGNRCLARLLNWMQENNRQCLVFATANRIEHLPRELIRAGRISKKFYTFLPLHEECVQILRQIIRREACRTPGLFQERFIREELSGFGDQVFDLASGMENKFYTGADIENLVEETLGELYRDGYLNPIGSQLFLEKLLEQVSYVKTFGETNMAETARYWLALRNNRFDNGAVTKKDDNPPVVLRFEDLTEDARGYRWRAEAAERVFLHPYDRSMRKRLMEEILTAANRDIIKMQQNYNNNYNK